MHRSPASPYAPLPGTKRRPRGLFIDRWGCLLRLVDGGNGKKAADVVFEDGVLDALFRATQRGWRIYLIGNEDEVARGVVHETEWAAIQEVVLGGLSSAGVVLSRDYTCTVHPEGQGRFAGDSVYSLPNTGAFYHAAHNDGIDLRKSWVLGDSTLELAAGWRAGLRLAAVRSGLGLSDASLHVEPELWGATLTELLVTLLELEAAQST